MLPVRKKGGGASLWVRIVSEIISLSMPMLSKCKKSDTLSRILGELRVIRNSYVCFSVLVRVLRSEWSDLVPLSRG